MSKEKQKLKTEDNKVIQNLLNLYLNQKDSAKSINMENLLAQTHILWSLKHLSSEENVEFSKILSDLRSLKDECINLLKSGKQIKLTENIVIMMKETSGLKYLSSVEFKEDNDYIIPSALILIYDVVDSANLQIKDFLEILLEIFKEALERDLFIHTDSFAFVKNIAGNLLIPITYEFLERINLKRRK